MYARAQNEVNSREFVNAMYSRARNAVISIACKGSSAVNVVHNFQGSCGACKGSKCCNFQGPNIRQFPGFSACKGSNVFISKVFCACKGSKCSYFVRACACRKVLQFPGSCDFQGFMHAKSIYCNFLGFCACRSSTCFTFQGCMCTKGLQMPLEVLHFPRILCTQGFHMFQFVV